MERVSTAREGEHNRRTRTVKLALEFGGSRPVRALWCVLLPYDHCQSRRQWTGGRDPSEQPERTPDSHSLMLAFASSSAPSALITT